MRICSEMRVFHVKGDLCKRYLKITGVVALYWFVSISTVFVNKTLINSQSVQLNAPLFVSWFQCVVTTVICYAFHILSSKDILSADHKLPPVQPFKLTNVKNVLPLSILFVFMIGFNNLCLSYVGIPFYLIGRSLTTVFNVIFSYIILNQKTSKDTIGCCGIIVFGFLLGIDQENFLGTFSFIGTIFGVLSSLSLSLYSIFTKKVLPLVSDNVVLLGLYNNIYSIFLFLPLMYLNSEYSQIFSYEHYNEMFWGLMIFGGICGFSIGYVTTLQIKITSPLTHNISGTAKACAQTVLGSFWYNQSKPFLWWLSNVIILFGSAAYTRIKQLEMKQSINIKGTQNI